MVTLDAKDVVAAVLVTVLLASLGYWYLVLPEYLAEKKRRERKRKEGNRHDL